MVNVWLAEPVSTQPGMISTGATPRHVLDSLDAAVCAVDRGLRVTLANQGWDSVAARLGRPDWRCERLPGRSLLDVLDVLGDHGRSRWRQICLRILDGEEANYWTRVWLPFDHGPCCLSVSAHALYDGGEVTGISLELRDVTDHALLEEEAVKRELELRGLYEVTQTISRVSDATDLFRRVTGHLGYLFRASICAIVRRDPETDQTATATPAHGLNDAEAHEFAVPEALLSEMDASTQAPGHPSYALHGDATNACEACRPLAQRWGITSLLLAPLRTQGHPVGYLVLAGPAGNFTDDMGHLLATFAGVIAPAIETSSLVLALQDRADRLSAALSEIEELDRLKDELVQNVSHELRLPLMVVQGYADLVKTGAFGPLNSDLQKAVDIISEKSALLARRISDIVTLRGLSQADLQSAPVSLAELAREAVERARLSAAPSGVVIVEDIVPESLPLLADRHRLEQVADELLGNAIKFSPDGGQVHVTVREGGDVVYLKVADQGIGIPHSQVHRIWDRFYQFDGSTKRRFGGSGVGLAVVKQIVEAHGGQVWAESEEGHGSQFYVALRMSCV